MLHVAFKDSAAGHLKRHGMLLGRREPVAWLPDHLTFGPIGAHVTVAERVSWFAHDLGWDWYTDVLPDLEAFWATATMADNVTAWLSQGSALELCGFLELVARRDGPIQVVDVTGVADAVGSIPAERSIELRLAERAVPLSQADRLLQRARWETLRRENALLRVLSGGELQSAPIDHYDHGILAAARTSWERTHDVLERYHPDNPHFLESRIRRLVELGRLEADGVVSMATALVARVRLLD